MDDEELIRRFQAGDDEAFTDLVNRHRTRVYRVAWGVLRDHAQADEAAQEAWVKAHRALARFKGQSRFSTWLHRITVNAALDLRSRESTQGRVREEAEQEQRTLRPVPADDGDALERLAKEQELGRLRAAVAKLPDRQRLTLTLKVQQDLKYTEIAEVLGCPVGTAKANFHHAVQNLKKLLVDAPGAEGAPVAVKESRA